MTVLVSVDHAGRRYPGPARQTPALNGVSCQVLAGDRIALVGRSGSGKSTLLHLMAGLDRPDSGTVTWPGLGAIDRLRPAHIGVALQSAGLVPWLTVAENVSLPLQLLGQARAAAHAAALLERFDLQALADKLPELVSGGQAQRVALARAMITRPALILADEPSGQLDRGTATATMSVLLGWVAETGAALVVATHDMTVADSLPTRWRVDHGVLATGPERLAS